MIFKSTNEGLSCVGVTFLSDSLLIITGEFPIGANISSGAFPESR
jgi:hypothetical protein